MELATKHKRGDQTTMTDSTQLAQQLNQHTAEEVASVVLRDLGHTYADHLIQTLTHNNIYKEPICADGEQLEFVF